MFTGIVEELGEVVGLDRGALRVRGPTVTADARPGDSVAVNGVCLTVVRIAGDTFAADVVRETLDRSALGGLAPGDPVNLERAATASTRLGGHLVQGHVDGVGRILSRTPGDRWHDIRVATPPGLTRYVVEKGSIGVDGVSLTVAAVADAAPVGGDPPADREAGWFEVSLIPTTLELTTLGRARVGDPVNLEVDVIAKYVEKLVTGVRR